MSGLKLGDLILDPRRVVYIPSLRALVCAGLQDALGVGIAGGLRGVIEKIDSALVEYKPESFVVLGSLVSKSSSVFESALTGMSRRWGKKVKLQLVSTKPDGDARALAEALGCEVHNELVWERYRFVEAHDDHGVELQLMTVAGHPNYCVKVGSRPFGGMKLAVFLKGFGRLTLPSTDPSASVTSVFKGGLERCDVFAVGHQRVLPMGKVGALKPHQGIVRGVPLAKSTLGTRRRGLNQTAFQESTEEGAPNVAPEEISFGSEPQSSPSSLFKPSEAK